MIVNFDTTFTVMPCGDLLCVSLRYDPEDPYTVTVLFDRDDEDPIRWVFARDLLAQGLDEPAGLMDVRVGPWREGRVYLRFTSHQGSILFDACRADLVRFLDRTYMVVPRGSESMDLDRLVEQLMEGAS